MKIHKRPLLLSKLSFYAALIFLGALLSISLTHRTGYVFTGNALNPDEAEFLAAGKLATQDLVPYRSYSTSTYGPFLVQLIGVIGVLGSPLTLPWAHLLSLALLLGILFVPFKVAHGSKSYLYFLGVVIPISLVTISGINSVGNPGPGEVDYLALNSELLPLFLLSLMFAMRKLSQKVHAFEYLVGILGFLASISKLQVAPLFLMVTLWFCIANRESENSKISIRKIYLTYALAWVLFFSFLRSTGNLKEYIYESILTSASYVSVYNESSIFVSTFETFQMLLNEPAVVFASAAVFLLALESKLREPTSRRRLLFTLVIPFAAMVIPGTNLGHYKWFFIWSLLYLPIVLLTFIKNVRTSKSSNWLNQWQETQLSHRIILLVPTFMIAIPLISSFEVPNKLEISQFTKTSVSPLERKGKVPGAIAKGTYAPELKSVCPEGSQVLIWGWAAEMYSYYGWIPVPRLVNDSVRIIVGNPNTKWVASNMSEIIEDKKASCIIDASGPTFFGGKSGKQLSKNKKISKELKENYRRVKVKDFDGVVYLPRTQQ